MVSKKASVKFLSFHSLEKEDLDFHRFYGVEFIIIMYYYYYYYYYYIVEFQAEKSFTLPSKLPLGARNNKFLKVPKESLGLTPQMPTLSLIVQLFSTKPLYIFQYIFVESQA